MSEKAMILRLFVAFAAGMALLPTVDALEEKRWGAGFLGALLCGGCIGFALFLR